MKCISCSNEHNEKFCPNCGQKSKVPIITFDSIFKDVFSTITNMDKGFLFNVKNLFLSPDKIVKDYLLGKRKDIFNPISFLMITITIYLIVDSLLQISGEKSEIVSKVYSVGYEAGKFIKSYSKYFWILSIIWLSISTKLIFKKYNYAEHLVINSFVMGQATFAGLVVFVIFRVPLLFNPIIYILIIWMTYQIFKTKHKDFMIFFQSVASTIFFFTQLALIAILIGVIRS